MTWWRLQWKFWRQKQGTFYKLREHPRLVYRHILAVTEIYRHCQ